MEILKIIITTYIFIILICCIIAMHVFAYYHIKMEIKIYKERKKNKFQEDNK